MPALITHYLHAEKVYDIVSRFGLLPKREPQGHEPIEMNAFLLGAQGPDFLFFHRIFPIIQPGKSLRRVGLLMHKIPADNLFSMLAKYCIENKSRRNIDLARAYAAGFVCHYMLDSAAHPFIYAMQSEMIEKLGITYYAGFVHSRVEHSIDVILLNKMKNRLGNMFDCSSVISGDRQILQECSNMLSFALERLIDRKIKPEKIMRGFKDYRNLAGFIKDRHGRKYRFFRLVEKIFHLPPSLSTFIRRECADNEFDYADFSHRQWHNPYDEKAKSQNYDFLQIFNKSVTDTSIMVQKFLLTLESGSHNMSFMGRKSYKTGLDISGNADFDDTY